MNLKKGLEKLLEDIKNIVVTSDDVYQESLGDL